MCVCAPLPECVYWLSSTVSHCLLTFYGFLFINWKHDGVLSGADGWSRRIEKAISFTGITACQAVNTHCCMCVQAEMEQLSLLLGSHGTHRPVRTHAHTVHCRQEEGSNNDQLKSVIHYCQVHQTLSLLKTGIIGGRRSRNLISKQLWLVTFGINRHFLALTFRTVLPYIKLNCNTHSLHLICMCSLFYNMTKVTVCTMSIQTTLHLFLSAASFVGPIRV